MTDDNVQIRITADAANLQAEFARAETALKRLAQAVQGTTDGLKPLNAATAQVIGQYDKGAATLARAQNVFQHISDALQNNEVSATQATRALQQITSDAEAAAGAQGHMALGTVGAKREMMVLAHEVVSGNWSRIPGSIMVLGERVGGLGGIFAALTSPVGLATAALAATVGTCIGLAAGAERAERAVNQLQTAFAAVGNGGRMSNQALTEVIDQTGRLPGVSREAATEIVEAFARTRQIGGQLFGELTATIDRSALAMGVDAPAAAKLLAAAFADPTRGAQQLHAAYGILIPAQINEIETLQRQSNLVGAQNILLQAWKDRLAELPPALTNLQQATNNLGNAWDRFLQSLGKTSAFQTARDNVAGLLDLMSHKLDPTPLDRYNKALEAYNDLAERLRAAKGSLLGKMGINPEVEVLTNRLQAAKADLDKAQEDMLSAAEPKAKSGRHDANPPGVNADQAAQIRQAHPGDATQIQALDDQIGVLNRDLETAKARLADLARTKGTNSEDYRAEKAIVDQDVASLAKLKAEKDSIGGKANSGGASQFQQWRAELEQRHAASQQSQADMLREDIAFWQAKRTNLQAGSAEAAAIEREIARDEIALRREVSREEIRSLQEQTNATRAGSLEKIAAAQREVQYAYEQGGTMTAAYKEALARQSQALREWEAEQAAIRRSDADADAQISRITVEAEKQTLDEEVAAGAIGAQRKVAILKGFTAQAYQEDLKRLQDEMATLQQGTAAYEQAYNKIRVLKARHSAEMANLDRQAVNAQRKDLQENQKAWESAFQPINRAFSTAVTGILQGTETWRQAEARAAQSVALSFAEKATEMAGKWAAAEMARLTASETADSGVVASGQAAAAAEKATQSTSILGHAGSAAAAVYDDVAQIPYVGWILAPAAAAAAFAGVAAFSAAGGWGEVPYDGALTTLHKQEMVLPASLAVPMRAMLQGGAFSTLNNTSNSTSVAGAPTVNVSFTANGRSSHSEMMDHSRSIAQAVAGEVRNNNAALLAAIRAAGG